ncbi:MAG TPA: FliA/WhiG family RNA polymerase sigma factor [Verrucomicrobiae bacterium]|nr:FliA/WhiG family RNA polymerase sigma factor [Verrucomicrobiae bacterium]
MPRAATLVASARKKSVRSTRTTASDPRSARVPRRPALRLVTSRKPAARPAPAARTSARTVAARASTRPAAPRQSTARVNGGSPTRATAPAALRNGASALRASGPAITYDKNDLLKRFAPLVRHVVERVAATLPRNVDHEDLYSAGVLGLLDAHAKFDTRKGVKFETYAVWRIKGAVLDQLRALDWASRSMRRKARNLDGVTRKLDQKLGRAASEEEVARELKMTRDDFYRLLDHVRGAVLVSLDEARTNDGEEQGTLADHLADPNTIDLESRLEDDQTKRMLLRAIDLLPEQERLVVALYYYEHLTLKEIGRTLGISESRVSQVHTRAMSRMKLRMQRAASRHDEAA